MIFDFSLCTAFLLVILVVYFRRELGKLRGLMLWQPLTKMVNSTLNSLTSENLAEITKELIEKFLMYCYFIYTIVI